MARDQGRDDSAERDKYLTEQRRQAAQARDAREAAAERRRQADATAKLIQEKPWMAGSAGVQPAGRPQPTSQDRTAAAREAELARDKKQRDAAVQKSRTSRKPSLIARALGKKKGG